jgi:putative ABC transport system ATP-binding protein
VLLQSADISVERKGAAPLRFADISLRSAGKTLLLGPSGSGKTTLLSVLAGLLKPTTGHVFFDGRDIYALQARARDRLRGAGFGFVFQTLHLLPSLTLRQNIALAADMAGAPRDEARLEKLLETLGLTSKAHRRPEALSQGEQQRAAIARAVLNRPKIILADEPTSALDDGNAAIVMKLLDEHAAETGAALLVATHDSRIAAHFEAIVRLDARRREAA